MATVGTPSSPKEAEKRQGNHERIFIRAIVGSFVGLLLLMLLFDLLSAPSGSGFLGFPYNTDDHMVYAAWMRQAMSGHFFFDNRFTTDSQPGLTVHIYFFALGLIAKLIGISAAANAARIGLSVGFLLLLFGLIKRLNLDLYTNKLIFILTLAGAGLGFAVWHDFGVDLVRPASQWMVPLTGGKLPTDVWQPEGYVFPSLLTNSLFVWALCLIVLIFGAVLQSQKRESGWKPVALGAVCMALLMNTHSYDVLLVALVLVGLLVASFNRKQVDKVWVAKAVVIGLGAVPAALWFVHVIQSDAVFAHRADTPTYTAGFRSVIAGYLPLFLCGYAGIARRITIDPENRSRRIIGLAIASAVFLVLTAASFRPNDGYMLTLPEWGVCFGLTLVALWFVADDEPAVNLFISWALVGLVAIYFPGLFQRKLAMGLSIPWAVLSGIFLAHQLKLMPRSTRNFVTAVTLLLFCATSIQWMLREVRLLRNNVSETTVQPTYLPNDIIHVLAYLNALPDGRHVVVAIPGVPSRGQGEDGAAEVDVYGTPTIPDYNPILSGLSGVYTYAGHWSETPDYADRRKTSLTQLFSDRATPEQEQAFLNSIDAEYVLTPVPGAISGLNPDIERLGAVVVRGTDFELVRVSR